PAIKTRLDTWKNHLDTFVRANHTCTNACHGACEGTAAYTDNAKMTFLCDVVMRKPANAKELDEQALILIHEAGHGALGTRDVAYDSTRLLNVIHKDFSLAEINTDSFVLLIQCLNGVVINGMGCSVPSPGDTFDTSLTSGQKSAAEETLAWLERWMDFVWQDVNNLYPAVVRAREAGKWLPDDSGSETTMDLLSKHLGLRRPEGSPAPTFRAQSGGARISQRSGGDAGLGGVAEKAGGRQAGFFHPGESARAGAFPGEARGPSSAGHSGDDGDALRRVYRSGFQDLVQQ